MGLRTKAGEAVMIVIMGAMVVGGIVVWLATGHFHMMPMHGDRHTEEKNMKEEAVSSAPRDSHHGSESLRAEERPMEHGKQNSKEE